MDFVVAFIVAMVAIFINVATAGIEERMVAPAVRELDTAEASIRFSGLGLKKWFQGDHRQQQCNDCENGLGVKVNAHVSTSLKFLPPIAGPLGSSILEAISGESL
jgi:hypothetical protein